MANKYNLTIILTSPIIKNKKHPREIKVSSYFKVTQEISLKQCDSNNNSVIECDWLVGGALRTHKNNKNNIYWFTVNYYSGAAN